MRKLLCGLLAAALVVVLLPSGASGHPERGTSFPSPAVQGVPAYRSSGPSVVVCKSTSRALLKKMYKGKKNARVLKRRLATLKRCRFHDIQPAINAAKSGYRVLIMPGTYKEQASRDTPVGSPGKGPCAGDYVVTEGVSTLPPPLGPRSNDPPSRADRNFVTKCPNSKNLITVVSDTRPEKNPLTPSLPKCERLCDLQIEGLGKEPTDVLIQADRKKLDGLRIDRATGIYLRNFTVEQAAFNDIDLVEVDGFRISKVVARYAQDYGILSFTSTHGLYDHIDAYGNGDSGIYPGSTQKGCATRSDGIDPNAYGTCEKPGCGELTIEIRDSLSHGNTLGYSGTAGNSTYVHDNRFYDNASGLATDSFASGHPGMPQECFHWVNNEIYSNNNNIFDQANQTYCKNTPFEDRTRERVCPQFQTPVGTGVVMGGANRNLLEKNYIYDNWRQGVILLSVPAALRNDNDPSHQTDTSNGNRFLDNIMGTTPDGKRAPNGKEFTWDGGGSRNCFEGNRMLSPSSPASLPACPGSSTYLPTNPLVLVMQIACTAWDPKTLTDPPGCDWFVTPAKPQ